MQAGDGKQGIKLQWPNMHVLFIVWSIQSRDSEQPPSVAVVVQVNSIVAGP